MVHGTKTTRTDKNTSKRASPPKDGAKKRAFHPTEKKADEPTKVNNTSRELSSQEEDDLLTPEVLLESYAHTKGSQENFRRSSSLEELSSKKKKEEEDKQRTSVSILELLSKKDNLERLAESVSKAVEGNRTPMAPINIPTKPRNSPPSTPPKKANTNAERFAGLSSSPSPNNLPLPSFSFLDQELSNGQREEEANRYYEPKLELVPSQVITKIPASNTNHLSKAATPHPAKNNKSSKQRKPSPPNRKRSPPEICFGSQ
jgi:hypothetical protein